MRGRFKRIVLLSMIVLVVLVPSVAAAEVPVSGPSGGQDVRVQPEASGVTIDLALPDYKIEDVVRDGVTYQQIVVDSDGWAQAGLAGAPRLPERGLMVAVPPTGDVTLEIIDAAPLTAAGTYRLQSAPFVNLEEDRLVETWQPSPDKVAEAAWTPAAQARVNHRPRRPAHRRYGRQRLGRGDRGRRGRGRADRGGFRHPAPCAPEAGFVGGRMNPDA